LIDFNDFESDWGKWNDGGSDARLDKDPATAKIGSYAIRLRDNTSSSIMTHEALDVSEYSKMRVKFSFYPNAMDDNEGFRLEVNDNSGTGWIDVAHWTKGIDFENGEVYYDAVE
jgi:hypothetical protein